jgi:DNA-binding winged helix-turn-helix (wHTH) protein/Tol biopolymer transport system component
MIYSFDGFELDAQKRRLLRNGQSVQLSSRGLDLLLALIESAGREITKEELMARVWADQIVEDANLTVTMSHLRKALGEKASDHRFIVTIPGRGYRFVGAVRPTETLIVEEHTVSQIFIEELDHHGESIAELIRTQPSPKIERNKTPQPLALPATTASKSMRVLVALILAAFVASGLAIAGFVKWRTTDAGLLPFAGAPIKQLTTKGRVGWIAVSPDAKFYAYTLNEHDFKQSLWLGQIGDVKEIELRPATGDHYRGVEFSPDGKLLYFTVNEADDDASNGLFKISPLGGVIQKLPVEVRDYFTLAPDGNQIAFVRNSKEKSSLVIAGLNGGEERELFSRPLDTAFFSRLAWSPDSKQIAVVAVSDAVNDSREIFLVQVSDGSIKTTDIVPVG